MLGDEDLDTFGADFGVEVRYGQSTVTANFDTEDALAQDGGGFGVVSRRQSVLVPAGALGTVVQDGTITIDGTDYVVRRVEREPPDMAMERITVAGGE
jgi:hypothetical protein